MIESHDPATKRFCSNRDCYLNTIVAEKRRTQIVIKNVVIEQYYIMDNQEMILLCHVCAAQIGGVTIKRESGEKVDWRQERVSWSDILSIWSER